jgi:hypothetical protein
MTAVLFEARTDIKHMRVLLMRALGWVVMIIKAFISLKATDAIMSPSIGAVTFWRLVLLR